MPKLPEHSHCLACGWPCAEGADFCGPECAEDFFAERKRTRRKDALFWGGIVLAVAVLVVVWLVL
ncbi:MAG: DUF2116 family Zn-ribbon domain-containing protein [Thermoplasmatales archaeon]|nr:DUF2116 family Zn-ribbon domain-containing protein [Thermoplasmatales archaeon]